MNWVFSLSLSLSPSFFASFPLFYWYSISFWVELLLILAVFHQNMLLATGIFYYVL